MIGSLRSAESQRGYRHAIDEFIEWYCSEPRLSFNRTVVLRYRIHLETRNLAPGTINVRLVDLVGKGGHVRTVPVPEWVKQFLDEWFTAARVTSGKLFRCVCWSGTVWGDGMTEKVVWHVVKMHAKKLQMPKLAPHDLRSVLFNWGWHLGMLRSDQERDLIASLEYQGKGTMQVDGQPCTLTKYRISTRYQTSGQRTQIACTRPNGQAYSNVEVLSGAYAWNEDIPGAELIKGKGKAT